MADPVAEASWKDKYRELLRDFETKERDWSRLESALRQAAGKLTIAAMGQSDALDNALTKVSEVLRAKGTASDVDAGVTTVIRQLQFEESELLKGSPDIRVLLGDLLRQIGRLPGFEEGATALLKQLEAVPAGGWAAFIDSIAQEVAAVVHVFRKQRDELEEFLDQMARQLSFLEEFTTWQVSAAQSRRDDSLGLERSMDLELGGLKQDVAESGDLAQIKGKVQSRLDAVAAALHDFRVTEKKRDAENAKRTAELGQEVMRLKVRTSELSDLCAAQESKLLIDSLTGAHSRYAYENRLSEEFQRWQRHAQPLSYVIFDIDRFKSINDQLGHDAGDRLLRAVAELLGRNKRAEDFLARLGGEEFALLLPNASRDTALAIANKLRTAVEIATFQHKGKRERVTISAGVTEFRANDTASVVYDRADRALYRAKEEGRNRCVAD